jgi:hypothetical protein
MFMHVWITTFPTKPVVLAAESIVVYLYLFASNYVPHV